MVQNRKKLIDILIGNLSNAVMHKILEKSIDKKELAEKYRKELINSFEIAKRYREKINPKNKPLSLYDINYVKDKIAKRVKSELLVRISKGYENISLFLVESETEAVLNDLGIK